MTVFMPPLPPPAHPPRRPRLAHLALLSLLALQTAAGAQTAVPAATPGAAARPTSPSVVVPGQTTRGSAAVVPTFGRTQEPRFDLAMNNAPAAQVFLQLAQGTPYNMLVAPEVTGTLSITLKDTTVPEAMETLRELFGYEYRLAGNRIFVYPNTVQTRLYRINYLPGHRVGQSDIRVSSTTMPGSGGSGGGTGGSGGTGAGGGTSGGKESNAKISTASDADFWRDVKVSLDTLIGNAGGRSVVMNPAAGVIVVKATPGELRQVENYLKAVQGSIERQVMLEAKIVEVQLGNDSQSGVNWAGFSSLGGHGKLTIGNAAPGATLIGGNAGGGAIGDGQNAVNPGAALTANALGRGFYGLAFQVANFAALLNFLQTQGDVQVLSSPRIATLNNQKAVLKVGSDELYVTGITSSTQSSASGTTTTPSLTFAPFFSGISLDVTPQIDDAGNVMLHVHPTISSVSEKAKNIDLGAMGAFRLPLAAAVVNETDSIVRVRDGQIVAIGGLMKEVTSSEQTGVPVLQDAPLVGGLFRQKSTTRSKRELVILLKPTVINPDGTWPESATASDSPALPVTLGGTTPGASTSTAQR